MYKDEVNAGTNITATDPLLVEFWNPEVNKMLSYQAKKFLNRSTNDRIVSRGMFTVPSDIIGLSKCLVYTILFLEFLDSYIKNQAWLDQWKERVASYVSSHPRPSHFVATNFNDLALTSSLKQSTITNIVQSAFSAVDSTSSLENLDTINLFSQN